MKKGLAIALCAMAAAFCFALVGCGGTAKGASSEYVGTWKATTVNYEGLELDASTLFGDDFALVLESGGTAKLTMEGETATGKWTEGEDGFSLDDSEGEMFFTKVGTGVVTLDYSGIIVTFEKS